MLIDFRTISHILKSKNISVSGALHIGAHDCEEQSFYKSMGISPEKTIWIDAMQHKVAECKERGIPNVFHAVITDKDNDQIIFHISNNGQSSSVLEFGTHAQEHPHVKYVNHVSQQTTTIDTFFATNSLQPANYDFWNFDIQGAELMALRGAPNAIRYAKAIYLEVNEKELYKGCGLIQDIDAFLAGQGFKRCATKILHHGWGDALYVKEE
jgi:FkbM family methyltransferase